MRINIPSNWGSVGYGSVAEHATSKRYRATRLGHRRNPIAKFMAPKLESHDTLLLRVPSAVHERGAVRARADAHAPSLRQPIGYLAGIGIADVDGHDAAALPGAAAEDLHTVDIGHAIQETRDQPFDMLAHPPPRAPQASSILP